MTMLLVESMRRLSPVAPDLMCSGFERTISFQYVHISSMELGGSWHDTGVGILSGRVFRRARYLISVRRRNDIGDLFGCILAL